MAKPLRKGNHGYPRLRMPSERMHLEARENTAKMHILEILEVSMATNNSVGKQHCTMS